MTGPLGLLGLLGFRSGLLGLLSLLGGLLGLLEASLFPWCPCITSNRTWQTTSKTQQTQHPIPNGEGLARSTRIDACDWSAGFARFAGFSQWLTRFAEFSWWFVGFAGGVIISMVPMYNNQ